MRLVLAPGGHHPEDKEGIETPYNHLLELFFRHDPVALCQWHGR